MAAWASWLLSSHPAGMRSQPGLSCSVRFKSQGLLCWAGPCHCAVPHTCGLAHGEIIRRKPKRRPCSLWLPAALPPVAGSPQGADAGQTELQMGLGTRVGEQCKHWAGSLQTTTEQFQPKTEKKGSSPGANAALFVELRSCTACYLKPFHLGRLPAGTVLSVWLLAGC